jgi:hypothetical protein
MRADSALMAAAPGGVFQGFADIGTVAPYALVVQQAGTDVLTVNAIRLFTTLLFQIKAIGPTASYVTIVTIADRIDALFKRTGPTMLSSGGVLACYREQSLAYEELVNGAQWSHLGGLYRIDLQGI